MFDLTGKICYVTGSARGIGKTAAEELAKLGANVAIADLNVEQAKETADEINKLGKGEAYAVQLNVGDNASIEASIKEVAEHFGGIDVVVNSAGILGASGIEEMEREGEWNRVIDIDLSGTFFVCQKALPYLKKSKAGRIINISSVSGRNGGFECSMAYAAAKGGVVAITRGMANRLASTGITVNAICPGTTETEMLKGYTPERVQHQIDCIPLGRLGQPIEIAAAVCYYASDESGFVTGNMHDINGGGYFG